MEALSGRNEGGGLTRFAPLLAVAFVVLFFIAFLLTNTPDENASDATWTSYYADSGHQAQLVIAGFLFVGAAICLLGFFSWLWGRVGEARRTAAGALSPLPLAAAVMASTCIGIAGVSVATVAGNLAFGNAPEPSPDVLRFADSVGWPILTVVGMIALGLTIATMSLAAHRAGMFSQRMRTFSLVAACFTAISFLFFPLVVMIAWFLVAGISLYRSHGRTATIPA